MPEIEDDRIQREDMVRCRSRWWFLNEYTKMERSVVVSCGDVVNVYQMLTVTIKELGRQRYQCYVIGLRTYGRPILQSWAVKIRNFIHDQRLLSGIS